MLLKIIIVFSKKSLVMDKLLHFLGLPKEQKSKAKNAKTRDEQKRKRGWYEYEQPQHT